MSDSHPIDLFLDAQAAAVPALEVALNLLSKSHAGSFAAAAALAAPALVGLFAPPQELVAIPSIPADTAKSALRALVALAKDDDIEIQDILLNAGAVPVLTQLCGHSNEDVKKLAGAILDALSEINQGQAMQASRPRI